MDELWRPTLEATIDTDPPPIRRRSCVWKTARREIPLGQRTCIVGIVNITPDSFSDGGRFLAPQKAIEQACFLAETGADIIDLGAESSRPGAEPISLQQELDRLLPVLEGLRRSLDRPISVDTWKSEVAHAALQAGAEIVNDISAFRLDRRMAGVAARHRAGVILMHMRGTPRDMQRIAPSPDILGEMTAYFQDALERASEAGIERDRIVLDPGIGFGKTVGDNLTILNRIPVLDRFQLPLLVGTSRKSFIGKILDLPPDRLRWGTLGSIAAAAVRGVHLVRLHDAAEASQALAIVDAILAERRLG